MMRSLLLASAAIFALQGPVVHAGPLQARNGGSSADCSGDGHTGAPVGTPTYAARRAVWTALALAGGVAPVCQVPGVDYVTGVDPAVTLLDPSNPANLPAGLSYNTTFHRLGCTVGTALTIQNYDFTLVPGGDGAIELNGCNNVLIKNVKLGRGLTGSMNAPIKIIGGSSNITITQVTIDRGGLLGTDSGIGESIYFGAAQGTESVTYSDLRGSDEHNISWGCQSGHVCNVIAKWNSIGATGYGQGNHGNSFQWLGDFSTSEISYNYSYNPQPSDALEAADLLTIDTTSGSTIATIHLTGAITQTSFLAGMSITSANLQSGTTFTPGGATNPQTITLSKTATATASGVSAAIPNAYPFGQVNPVRFVVQSNTAPYGGLTAIGNVFDGDGPIKPGTYAFACGGNPSPTDAGPVVLTANYFNPNGYQGVLVNPGNCPTISGSGNKNMVTGATIPVP